MHNRWLIKSQYIDFIFKNKHLFWTWHSLQREFFGTESRSSNHWNKETKSVLGRSLHLHWTHYTLISVKHATSLASLQISSYLLFENTRSDILSWKSSSPTITSNFYVSQKRGKIILLMLSLKKKKRKRQNKMKVHLR